MQATSQDPVIVLGAGPAGLGAAYRLASEGVPVLVLEQEPRVGGMGATVKHGPYMADYGPHTFHLKDTVVTRLFEKLAGPDVNKVTRNARIWLFGKTMPFPLRMQDALTKLGPWMAIRIMTDFLYQQSLGRLSHRTPASFEDWGTQQFGGTLYRLAFGNYSEKMWGLAGRDLSVKLAKQKLVGLSLWHLILATLGLLDKNRADALGLTRDNLYDAYPKYGIGTFFEAMAAEVTRMGGTVMLSAKPLSVRVEQGNVTAVEYEVGGQRHVSRCKALISSVPLPALAALLPGRQFESAQRAAARIKYRSLIVVHFVLDQENFSEAHWTYLLDPRLLSNRLSEQKHLCKEACPDGQTLVTLDITCNYDDYLWRAQEGFLIGLGMNDLTLMGLHPRTIVDAFVLKAPNVYPIYSLGFERDMESIIGNFRQCANLFSIGRHGLLLNNDMHDSIEMGFFSSQVLLEGKASSMWYDIADRYVRDRLEGIVRDPIKFELKNKA